jgi:CO dehydrogenase/acetyl-CoA synthase beta subunit
MKYMPYIKNVKHITNYKLKIEFDNGTLKTINLETFMKNNKHPIIKRFAEIEKFKEVRVEDGTICWGNNEFDINPISIYKGKFD